MPTPEQVRHAVDGYVFAYERNDREAFVALFATDARLEDPVGTPAHEGREAIGAFWDTVHQMADRIVLEAHEIIVCGSEAAMIMRIDALTGDSGMEIDAVDVFEVDDEGRIASLKAYWDMAKARPITGR